MSEKITFKSTKEMVDGVAYPSQGTGARYVWDAADAAHESGENSTDLVAKLVESTDMSKGTISSQLTYWRKATGKALAKKVDESAAEKAAAKQAAKEKREADKAAKAEEKQRKAEEKAALKAEKDRAKAEKAEQRRLKDEERLRKLQEKVAQAQQSADAEVAEDEE
jgi:hypothetical protein